MKSRAALILAACALLAAALAPSAAPAAEAGVVLTSNSAQSVQGVRELGARWVRVFVLWRDFEPARGVYSAEEFAAFDNLFASLPAGTKVIADVVEAPSWETGSTDPHAPPANDADYASFAQALARHWGSRVAAYEIWNEEDASRWWSGGPNPAAYAALLRATYPAVKAAEPNATVVLGGLTGNDYSFLEGVYAAGGKGYFDAVGVHTDTACNTLSPYTYIRDSNGRIDPDAFLGYREVRATMLAHGDDKPIWMTELSWRTTDAVCGEGAWAGQKPEGVSEKDQALYLQQGYHCLAHDPYVQVALWFPLLDEGKVTSGLERADGRHKLSFPAMRDEITQGDRVGGECGSFSGPAIHIASPTNGRVYSGYLPVDVSASSSQGVGRITIQFDGHKIRNFTDKSFPSELHGAILWHGAASISYGRHTFEVLAVDKIGNVSHTSVTIDHVRPGAKIPGAQPGSRSGANHSGSDGSGHHGARHHHARHRRRHHRRRRRRHHHHR